MSYGYQVMNKYCPTCGKEINVYSYQIIDDKKYCIGCEPK